MFNRKEANKFTLDLIVDGKNCITKLSQDDKEKLTALIIEGHNKFHAVEFVSDADLSNELPFMLAKYMSNKDPIVGLDILDFMIKNAINHAGNTIVDLLIDQEKEYRFYKDNDGA